MSDYAPEVIALAQRLKCDAEAGGYRLNSDQDLTLSLVAGLLKNEQRYGYPMCPCRLAFGTREQDLDLICPCDYRDADLLEFGQCYCGLYLSKAVRDGLAQPGLVPERRPQEYVLHGFVPVARELAGKTIETLLPVWRCRVCGYLCAREQPPEVCPVCKARKDRLERFEFSGS